MHGVGESSLAELWLRFRGMEVFQNAVEVPNCLWFIVKHQMLCSKFVCVYTMWRSPVFPWSGYFLSLHIVLMSFSSDVTVNLNCFLFFFTRSFTTLCYSADGQSILAGGLSKFVCIYNVKEQILMKKFEISCNYSLDAMEVCEHGSLFFISSPPQDFSFGIASH